MQFSLTARPDEDRGRDQILHGGDLGAAKQQFPSATTPWLDLSTGINANHYPLNSIPEETWTRLPELKAVHRLQVAAAEAFGAATPQQIVPAPGTQALIQVLPRLFQARRVAVLDFGYQEHPASWRKAGAEVVVVEDVAALTGPGIDVAIVVNPNNPDGRIVEPQALHHVAMHLNERGGLLIVDEAFMDLIRPSASLVAMLPEDGAIVLRSFGKAYGLAGVRLGFAIGGLRLAERLRAALGPWAVSGPAIALGTAALSDETWLEKTMQRLIADTAHLDGLLQTAGFSIVGGTSLFRLARHAHCAQWFQTLGQNGILVRSFPERPNWLRFGIPGQDADWARLQTALQTHQS